MAASRSLPRPLSASTSDHTHCYAKRRNPPLQFCPSVAHCNLAQAPPSHTTHKNFSGFDFPSAPTPRSASTAILDGVGPAGEEARLPRALFFPSKPPRTAQPLLAPWRFFDLKMASLGSRPLLLEALNGADGGAGGGGPVPLQSGLTYGGRSAIFRGNVDIASGGSCWVRFPARRMSSGVSVGAENGKGIRATKKVGNLEGESDDAGDGGDPNSAPAIVDKSRQLLSMQQDFAKQIQFDEKNTRVSLFVSTSAEDKKSSTRFTRTYNVNQVSTESFTNGMHNGSTASSGSVQSTETKTPKTQHVGTPRNSTGETNIHEDSPQAERPSVDAKSATDTTTISSTGLVLPKKEDTEQTVGAKPDHTDSEATASSEDKDVDASPLAGLNVMNVILIAGECAPWSKTGGLGDVAGALPKALARRGHRVMVVAPRYGNYAEPKHIGVSKRYKVGNQDMEVSYYHAYIDGVDFVFIDSPMFSHRENNIYGGDRLEILKRMVLLCKAAVEVPWHVPCGGVCYGDGNLVFIANDWHTALLPVYLKAYYRDIGLMRYTRSVLVIHNIAHQGRGPVEDFNHVDLPERYVDLFKLFDPIGGEHFNIFAAGLKTADRVVTVSHGYAWELKTSEGGWGLHEIINENDWKLRGIVNGIDTKDWSPELDVHLQSDGYVNYSSDTLQRGKAQCKAALQKELGLPVRAEVPLVGFIGRLDHQKGVDLIAEAMPWIVSQDVQLVMLGTGRPDLEEMLRRFEREHRDKVRGWVGFSVKVAHRITAGADVLLMPSRFEPCGLNQLYAMRYGTVPVVHAVGGLRDTVVPFDPYGETGFGWTFDRAEAGKLIHALGNCFNTYWNYKESWEGLQARGMAQDLSWDNAAKNYEEVLLAAKYQW